MLTKRDLPILAANLVYVPIFTVAALRRGNIEFLLYVAVILLVGAWIIWKQHAIRLSQTTLWGLTIWGLLHMAGGNIRVGDGVLYGVELIPIWSRLQILRYDQLVHMFGFGVATLVGARLLEPHVIPSSHGHRVLWIILVLVGCGFGALNELVEFVAVLALPETGVGGYENTLTDLAFNLLGSLMAATLWVLQNRRNSYQAAHVTA